MYYYYIMYNYIIIILYYSKLEGKGDFKKMRKIICWPLWVFNSPDLHLT